MKKFIGFLAMAVGILIAGHAFAAADVYTIDPVHSSIGFSIKHMMVSNTTGTFDDFKGTVAYDPADPASFKAESTIEAKSINTRQDKRDTHLRGADFFDVEKFPTITFVSKSLSGSNGAYTLTGDFTMKGVTKEVSFPVTISGPVQGPMGGMVIGMEGQLTINRQDYGVSYGKILDNGGLAVGNDVVISVSLEAGKK